MNPFATTTDLMTHQREAVAKVLPSKVAGLFMDMGTGKSRTTIELARLRSAKIDKVVWFCPVSLKETIRYEILKHTDSDHDNIYTFDDRTNERTIPRNASWYIVGTESMSQSDRVALTVNNLVSDKSMVVVDESSYIKGHRALRTQRLIHICERARYRLILTGTPLSQGVEDLYSQMYFLSPKILGYRSWYSFAANHLEYSDKYPGMIVAAHNTEYLAAKIKPYVYQVTKDECLDLPEKVFNTYYFSMSPQQRYAYQTAKEEILLELEMDDWDSIVIFRLFTALQAIVCGFWNRHKPDGTIEHHEFLHDRIDSLMEAISQIPAGEKIVIWAKYHFCIREIIKAVGSRYGTDTIAEFHGGLTERRRNSELNRFRRNARFLVATQGAGGHGLNLTETHYVIFYANGFKFSERLQAEDRCHRIGQEHRPTYIDIHCLGSIDDRIESSLSKKSNTLTDFRREVEKVKGLKNGKERLRKLVMDL